MLKKHFLFLLFLVLTLKATPDLSPRIGINLVGYSVILTENFGNQFFYDGWAVSVDAGILIGDHIEPGVRMEAQSLSRLWFTGFNQGLETIEILPYVRYYFLKNPKIRPYVLGALGVSWSWLRHDWYELQNGRFEPLEYYSNFFLGARGGLGVRVGRVIDFSVTYAYSGSIRQQNFNSPPKFPPTDFQNVYHLHMLQISLGMSIGGHMKSAKAKYREKARMQEELDYMEDYLEIN